MMNWSFWKGVLVGVGGLLFLSMFMSLWGWVPWLLLGAGGVYGYYRLTRKQSPMLEDNDRIRQLTDEVDKRLEELRRGR